LPRSSGMGFFPSSQIYSNLYFVMSLLQTGKGLDMHQKLRAFGIRNPSGFCSKEAILLVRSAAVGEQKHQQQDDDGNHGQPAVIENLTGVVWDLRFCQSRSSGRSSTPTWSWVFQVALELTRVGVAVFRVPLQRAVKNLLQLRRDRWVGD
jgi:hypothetical protein